MLKAGLYQTVVGSPERDPDPIGRLSREQVVNRIIAINRSATEQFLARFRQPALEQYLDRLLEAQRPRPFSPAGRLEITARRQIVPEPAD